MFSSKKIFFSNQNDNYQIITGENPYNLPTNDSYFLISCVDLNTNQGNEVNMESLQSSDGSSLAVIGIPSKEKVIILSNGSLIVLDAPLKNSDGSTTNFGKSISITEEMIVVSAPNYKHTENRRSVPSGSDWSANDIGYAVAYFKFPNTNKWYEVGVFCGNDMELMKPVFEENFPKTKFGTHVWVDDVTLSGQTVMVNYEDHTKSSKIVWYKIQNKDLLPCQFEPYPSLQTGGYPENAKYLDPNRGFFTEPEYSDSSNTHRGRVINLWIGGEQYVNIYGNSYEKLGYSFDRSIGVNETIPSTVDVREENILIGAPGVHPFVPSKGKVVVYTRDVSTNDTYSYSITGDDDDDGFGKAVCSVKNDSDQNLAIIASDNYIKSYRLLHSPPDTSPWYGSPYLEKYRLDLPQGVEVLNLISLKGGDKRTFHAILSVNDKIYCAAYAIQEYAPSTTQEPNTGWRPGVPF